MESRFEGDEWNLGRPVSKFFGQRVDGDLEKGGSSGEIRKAEVGIYFEDRANRLVGGSHVGWEGKNNQG